MENNKQSTFLIKKIMNIILRDYQQDLVNKINASTDLRNCVQSPTGSGKTIILAYLANNFKGKVLILVDKKELLDQTNEWLSADTDVLEAGTKELNGGRIVLGMVRSVKNRLDNLISINDFDLIIADEVQSLEFISVLEGYKNKVLGFTATPVIDKKEHYTKCCICNTRHEKKTECCGGETYEYSKPITLKKWYGELITGTPIGDLIEIGKLVNVRNFCVDVPNLDKLKTDKSDQFTLKSQAEVFDNIVSLENLIANYQEHCIGLKTMVFNTSIKSNSLACEEFVKLGYNARYYDSESNEDRTEIVEWFKNTKDAVLMSVGVFTTGFDVDDVEVIIMNRATKSLSLYHQIVGRGGRPSTSIFKPYFKLIDLGGNVDRFDSWSDEVDWKALYDNKKEKRKPSPNTFVVCPSCGYMAIDLPCPECEFSYPEPCDSNEGKTEKDVEKHITTERGKLPKPNPKHILNHALANNLDVNEAKNNTAEYIVKMFRSAKTSAKCVEEKREYIEKEIENMIRPIYFDLHKSELKGNRKRTREDFKNKVMNKIDKYYENRV